MINKSRAANTKARNKRVIEGYKKTIDDYDKDLLKKERKEECLCKFCKYVHYRVGGTAMTTKDCGCCGVKLYFASTATDDLCINCAKTHGHCKRCSQKMN